MKTNFLRVAVVASTLFGCVYADDAPGMDKFREFKAKIVKDLENTKIDLSTVPGEVAKVPGIKDIVDTLNSEFFSEDTSLDKIKTAYDFVLKGKGMPHPSEAIKKDHGKPDEKDGHKFHHEFLKRCLWHSLKAHRHEAVVTDVKAPERHAEQQEAVVKSYDKHLMFKLFMLMLKEREHEHDGAGTTGTVTTGTTGTVTATK